MKINSAVLFLFFLMPLFASFIPEQAQAQYEFGLSGGFRSGQATTDLAGAYISAKAGYQLGAVTWLQIYQSWSLRTGFLYTQRPATLTNTKSGDVDIQFAYFDVPATASYKFSDYAGIFAGPVIAFNQSKDVSCSQRPDCAAIDVRGVLFPIELGLDFKFAPQLGGEVYFEYVPGNLSVNVAEMKTLGANLVFFFE